MNKVAVEVVLCTYKVVLNVVLTVWNTVWVALTIELHRFAKGRKKKNDGSGRPSNDDPSLKYK